MKNISAIVITKNEGANIADCLKSIDWADEIILVDAESSDRTVEIAKSFNSKIFIHQWEGFAKQKEFALTKTSNEWILHIDADERISPALRDEIIALQETDINGYYLRRQNYLLNKHIKSCGWDNDYQLRLVRKSKSKLNDRLVHEKFIVDGKTGQLKNRLIHLTFTSIEKTIFKINHYTSLKAEELFLKNRKVGGWGIVVHGFTGFFKFYFLLGGFKDGIHGLVISLLHLITTLVSYIKLWEKHHFPIKKSSPSSANN
jgi:glycosyltransferase involved in cell wall biosynthesis